MSKLENALLFVWLLTTNGRLVTTDIGRITPKNSLCTANLMQEYSSLLQPQEH